ncbi:hypothetical protein RUM43_008080 [Polyplax serrata]|uniref:Ubiquitin-like modifier-activating enzyme ATG7 n=1 Tax=Polyplax serrata TaxID=468196 RepID=A0AAN8P6K2_POLSC
MEEQKNLLKFVFFKSQVDPSFWQRLTELKLDKDRLNENSHQIWGYYSNRKPEGQNQLLSVDASSFNQQPDDNRIFGVGLIINKNTIEGFKEENKIEILKNEGKEMMKVIKEEALNNPSLLARFYMLTYANLKSYQYYYWFAFPAPTFLSYTNLAGPQNVKEVLSDEQQKDLCEKYSELDSHNKGYFFIHVNKEGIELVTVAEGIMRLENNTRWILGFSDTSNSEFPSWPLRNFLALVTYHCPDFVKTPLQIVCLRLHFSAGTWTMSDSLTFTIEVNVKQNPWTEDNWVGWEKNEKQKLGPQVANMKHHMDPLSLAETSVDLNLKLMKWQILPNLNLDVVKRSKCLLFGAGTLGCVVARHLMSWGVRHVTFVDCGTISHSNPVRQFLYKFEDVGKSKAETAAAAVREIAPGMVSSGFSFTVPMPGHPVGDSLIESTRRNVKQLEELIEDHDVTFLLMDSRESRWLPTLVASAKGKLAINAALGFDSYLVMRHGVRRELPSGEKKSNISTYKLLPGDKLGCYFCNDVTAPGNSFKGRTLDQQCTVTRPGVSGLAGALAVELFVSILQHSLRELAPAETDPESTATGSQLGIVPHSIRGFISHYSTLLPAVEAFSSCVACSEKVISKYRETGFDFVLKALESKAYLEDLCGLTELQNEPLIEEILEFSESESDE